MIVFGFGIFSLVLSGIYTGFRINFNMSEVYKLRLEAREFNMPVIFQYLRGASDKIISIGLIYYLISKKRTMAFFLIFIQILNFSFNGKKSVLFTLVIILGTWIFYKKKHIKAIIPSFLLLNLAALAESLIRSGKSQITNYIIRRVMFAPTLIGHYYYDFFSKNEFDYLRQSILRWFGFESPYSSISIQRLIGLTYYGNIENNANTGLVGDAFANFGWIALFLYPVLIVFTLRILDYCSKEVDYRINIILCVLVFYAFINGSFFTLLLNGGLILTCITMYLCPQVDVIEKRKSMGGEIDAKENI